MRSLSRGGQHGCTYLEPCWTAVLTAALCDEEDEGPFVLSS